EAVEFGVPDGVEGDGAKEPLVVHALIAKALRRGGTVQERPGEIAELERYQGAERFGILVAERVVEPPGGAPAHALAVVEAECGRPAIHQRGDPRSVGATC